MATKEVNRAQVVQTMKVRTSLKGDGSWIRRVADTDEEEKGKPRKPALPKKPTGLFSAESSPVTSLAPCNPYSPTVTPDVDPLTAEEIAKCRVRPLAKSYVLSAAKTFESMDSPTSPPPFKISQSHLPISSPEELSEAVEESVDPPTAELEDASLGKPVEQPAVEESVNEPAAGKSVDAPADQPEAAEPSVTTTEEPASVEEAVGELIAKLTAEPTVGPTVEPASEVQSEEAAVESVLEPVAKPVDSVSEEPAVRPVAVEAIELVVEPVVAVKPVVEPVAAVKPVVEPVTAVKPVVEPVTAVEPVVEPVATVEHVAAVKPVVEPVAAVKPVVEPVATVKPVVEPVATVTPVVEPVAAVKPVVEPVAAVKPVVEESTSEPIIEAEVEPVAEAAVEVVQELSAAIELEEALEVELPAAEVVEDYIIAPASEPTPSPCGGQCPSLIEQQEDAEPQHQIIHDFRHTKDGKAICSYCDKSIDGNVKITINYPQTYSHPDCFKCGLCGKALGDMTTAMFVHRRVIHCDSCFIKTT